MQFVHPAAIFMSIIVCGINYKTAPIALREKAVFALDRLPIYLNDLQKHEDIQEAVILSTCNRSEVICRGFDAEQLITWFCQQHQLSREEIDSAIYCYQDRAAIEHLMSVACGLDSMVLGESEILGQMKTAFSESCAAGMVGSLFNRLFQQVFSVAKEVRTNTSIGACPMSVAGASVSLAKELLPNLKEATILVIGAGDTIELVLRHLKAQDIASIVLVNRRFEKATELATKYNIKVLKFAELANALVEADMVMTATSSAFPIITKEMMQRVWLERKERPMVIVDIAVPRDVESSVKEVSDLLHLYCIDDLKTLIQQTRRGREHAAEKAQEIIQQKSNELVAWLDSLDMVATTIRAYRQQIEDICFAELEKAKKQLQRGEDAAQVLTMFAYAFTNKLMHIPSVQLRQAGVEGRLEIVRLAQQLFAIPEQLLI